MLEVTYIYGLILACIFVYKTLSNDPDRDKIWGIGPKDAQLDHHEREIELLKNQLEHYRSYNASLKENSSREEVIA